jgi:hypothetical protein
MLGWVHPTVVHRGRRVAAAEHWRARGRSCRTHPIADARPSAAAVRFVVANWHAAPKPDCPGVQVTGAHPDSTAANAHPNPDADLHADSAARGDRDANTGTPAIRDAHTTAGPLSGAGPLSRAGPD